jgi:hypothetical protein
MTRYTASVLDQYNRPVPGAAVYVYNAALSLDALTDDAAVSLLNPVTTDEFGVYYFNSGDGTKTLDIWFGGVRRWREVIIVGASSEAEIISARDAAAVSASAAAASAGTAGVSSTAAGTSATSAANSATTASAASVQAGLYAAAALALTNGYLFDTAAEGVSQGVVSLVITAAGAGGANGTFQLAFSGGGGSGATGTFTVSGGAVTAVAITKRGKNYTSSPTASTAASAGLAGATVTPARGVYAVPDGEYYLVKGSGDTFATLYKNVTGDATSQSLSIPSSAALTTTQADIARLTGAGDYLNLLHGLTPAITNVSTGAAGAATLAETSDGLLISVATFNQQLGFTTNIKAGAPNSRFTATIKIGGALGGCKVGLVFINGASKLAITWAQNGWLHTLANGGSPIVISQALPTYVTGDTLTMEFNVTSAGAVYVTCSKGTGNRVCIGLTGVPIADVGLSFFDDTTAATAAFKVVEQALGPVAYGAATSISSAALSADVRAPGAKADNYLSFYSRSLPSGFTASRLPSWFTVGKRPDARYVFTSVDLQPLLDPNDPTVFVQYVDIASGNDANAGTAAAPLKSIRVAMGNVQSGSRAIVLIKGGLYDFANSWRGANPLGTVVQVQSWDGNSVISSMHDAGLVWALDSGVTYSATFAETVLSVFDAVNLYVDPVTLLATEYYSRLTLAASLALCRSTAGSYFISGTTIYVHRSDGIAPTTANTRVFKKKADGTADHNGVWLVPGGTLYLGQYIDFHGGTDAFASLINFNATQQSLYHKDCGFKYGSNCGLQVCGNTLVIGQRPVSVLCGVDNLHYDPAVIDGTGSPTVIEQDAISRYAGWDGQAQNNNSSSHGGTTLRLATKVGYGDYNGAQGRGVHDIYQGTSAKSWHLGITVRNSGGGQPNLAVGLAPGDPNVGSDASKQWNDTVTTTGATHDQEARCAGATIYDYDLVRGATDVVGPGTITTYVP